MENQDISDISFCRCVSLDNYVSRSTEHSPSSFSFDDSRSIALFGTFEQGAIHLNSGNNPELREDSWFALFKLACLRSKRLWKDDSFYQQQQQQQEQAMEQSKKQHETDVIEKNRLIRMAEDKVFQLQVVSRRRGEFERWRRLREERIAEERAMRSQKRESRCKNEYFKRPEEQRLLKI